MAAAATDAARRAGRGAVAVASGVRAGRATAAAADAETASVPWGRRRGERRGRCRCHCRCCNRRGEGDQAAGPPPWRAEWTLEVPLPLPPDAAGERVAGPSPRRAVWALEVPLPLLPRMQRGERAAGPSPWRAGWALEQPLPLLQWTQRGGRAAGPPPWRAELALAGHCRCCCRRSEASGPQGRRCGGQSERRRCHGRCCCRRCSQQDRAGGVPPHSFGCGASTGGCAERWSAAAVGRCGAGTQEGAAAANCEEVLPREAEPKGLPP